MAIKRYSGPLSAIAKVLRADSKYIGAADFADGVERCLIITGVDGLENEMVAGRTVTKKMSLALKWPDGTPCTKRLIINSTRFEMLKELHGKDHTDQWMGKPIWLGVGKTKLKGETVACVVIRNRRDMPKNAQAPLTSDDHPTVTHDPSESGVEPGDAAE